MDEYIKRLCDNDATLRRVCVRYEDVDANALSNGLRKNTVLLELSIEGCRIGDQGASALADALKVNTTLKTLDVSVTGITVTLADALKVNTSLKRLILADNNIGCDGMRELANALKVNTTLRYLCLSRNRIITDGACDLAEALKVNTTLAVLYVDQNNINVSGLHALKSAFYVNYGLLEVHGVMNQYVTRNERCTLLVCYRAKTAAMTLIWAERNGGLPGVGKHIVLVIAKDVVKHRYRDMFIWLAPDESDGRGTYGIKK